MPDTPTQVISRDTLVAGIILACIFGAALLYGLSLLVTWVGSVKSSTGPAQGVGGDYVAQKPLPVSVSSVSHQETDAEAETETWPETQRPPAAPAETAYVRMTKDEYEKLKARAFLEGAAHAFGTLQGRGDLADTERRELLTEAKRSVFGTSGRTLSAANKLIAAAAQKAAPASEDERLVPLRGGEDGYVTV